MGLEAVNIYDSQVENSRSFQSEEENFLWLWALQAWQEAWNSAKEKNIRAKACFPRNKHKKGKKINQYCKEQREKRK